MAKAIALGWVELRTKPNSNDLQFKLTPRAD